mmetsp:Transcript_98890/g.196102  ORF Transcript_98890/g.196102 Transcript_98890/m.196102 type:complete len:84 (-) Transcript_98890:243-494(-)
MVIHTMPVTRVVHATAGRNEAQQVGTSGWSAKQFCMQPGRQQVATSKGPKSNARAYHTSMKPLIRKIQIWLHNSRLISLKSLS